VMHLKTLVIVAPRRVSSRASARQSGVCAATGAEMFLKIWRVFDKEKFDQL